jgi:hypothetical protein
MVGSSHTRRLTALVLAGVFIFAASGCYVGTTAVSPGYGSLLNCPSGVNLGPGKITGGGDTTSGDPSFWRPAPTAVSARFAVTSSDSNQRITVDADYFVDSPNSFISLGVVWDGTRSTGPKTVPMVLSPTVGFAFFLYAEPTPVLAHMHWWMTALDAAGNEVGFVDCLPYPGL